MLHNESDIMRRAMRAYFNSTGEGAIQPSSTSGVEEHQGRHYAVLNNQGGILAVYRLRPEGSLRRLRRWPATLV